MRLKRVFTGRYVDLLMPVILIHMCPGEGNAYFDQQTRYFVVVNSNHTVSHNVELVQSMFFEILTVNFVPLTANEFGYRPVLLTDKLDISSVTSRNSCNTMHVHTAETRPLCILQNISCIHTLRLGVRVFSILSLVF